MPEKDRLDILLDAIELERKNEENYYLNVQANKPIAEKVENGVAWYPIEITKKHYTVGEYVEIEVERVSTTVENHRIRTGSGVSLFINIDNEQTTFSGTVSYVRNNKMRIILNDELLDKYDISNQGSKGIELIYDERPYKIMKEAILDLRSTSNPGAKRIRKAIESKEKLEDCLPHDFHPIPHLNESQNNAIRGALSSAYLSIIHGPPGTGKTTTIVGLAKKLLKSEKQILICAPSNNAVDLLATKLNLQGVNVLRIGNITRIDDDITHLTLDEKVRNSEEWSRIKKVKIEAEQLSKKANKFKRSFGPEEKKQRYLLRREARETRKWAKELEYRLTQHIISEAEVVLTTLIGASHSYIKDRKFKTCIIDEASQALEPECWNVILKSERTVLVGDHKQLPPTIKSKEAENLNFNRTLLDLLAPQIHHCYLLEEQYRMHDKILNFSNSRYYNGKIHSAVHVANHTVLSDETPLIFIDTAGTGFEEEQIPGEQSHFNSGEYNILREHLLSIFERALGHSIGIITPYAEQVRYIRKEVEGDKKLKTLDISIDSIDGFQGQERDIIYLSLVRSNDQGIVGFLADERRFNVALTRAKKKLVVIGDTATLNIQSAYSQFVEYVEKEGKYMSAWEFMS